DPPSRVKFSAYAGRTPTTLASVTSKPNAASPVDIARRRTGATQRGSINAESSLRRSVAVRSAHAVLFLDLIIVSQGLFYPYFKHSHVRYFIKPKVASRRPEPSCRPSMRATDAKQPKIRSRLARSSCLREAPWVLVTNRPRRATSRCW